MDPPPRTPWDWLDCQGRSTGFRVILRDPFPMCVSKLTLNAIRQVELLGAGSDIHQWF